MKKEREKKKRDPAPHRGATRSKRAVEAAEAKAKANAKTPGEKRAAAAGNLPVKDPKAKELAAKVAPPPVKRPLTMQEAWAESDEIMQRLGSQYARLEALDTQIDGLKKQRKATEDNKESLVRQLMDIHADIRRGQARLDLKPPAPSAQTNAYPAPIAVTGTKPPETTKADAKPADATKTAEPAKAEAKTPEPKGEGKDAKKDTKAA